MPGSYVAALWPDERWGRGTVAFRALGASRKRPFAGRALEGRFRGHHRLLVAQMLAHLDYLDKTIETLSEVDLVIAPFSRQRDLLVTIPGVAHRSAEVIVAETGGDMSRFPSAAHLASWAGACPGNNESAGKHRSGRARKGSSWLRKALTEAGRAAVRSKGNYLAAQYNRIKGRRGPSKAAFAVGHSILVIAYHLLDRDEEYTDLGADYFIERQDSEACKKRLVRQLERMGHKVTLEPADRRLIDQPRPSGVPTR